MSNNNDSTNKCLHIKRAALYSLHVQTQSNFLRLVKVVHSLR